MPKPSFIPNIDDANAEVERLTTALETGATDVTKLTNDLAAANGLLEESNTNVTRLTGELATANERVTKLDADLKAANGTVSTLQTELATAKNSATKTIAKAGITPAPEKGSTGNESIDNKKELKGIQRAIAAHTERVTPKA